MNTATDNIVGILVVLAIFVVLALPSLIGLARDRHIDRQLREAQQADRTARGRQAITAQDVTRAA
ncbi:hypothetical protein RB628_20095 [Streptomyces sp. ADMS]|uniref:hypothetical protein n=1 Tax=Streptomyces sp. ADMS TaxID=3071415 RepID=UPI00296E72DD|nr:hypothetical protein [Streptomyces sp. ADMS]MDW4907583.1 hypothetical protein [Streptomyces sp. ADMS]